MPEAYRDYSLALYSSLKQGKSLVGTITHQARNWRRSIRWNGGPWLGSFEVDSDDPAELQDWFFNRLGYHLEERTNGLTWVGMIYDLELTMGGVIRRRSLDTMVNAAIVGYTNGGVAYDTGWAVNSASLARYGRREEYFFLEDYPPAAATERRAVLLGESAWPWARPVSFTQQEAPSLTVQVCGYAFTAGWRYVPISEVGTYGNVSQYVADIISAGCTEFLTPGVIRENTLQVERAVSGPRRCWPKLAELAELGGPGHKPWRFNVDCERRIHYEEIDPQPLYVLQNRGWYDEAGASLQISPWAIRPGVVRDIAFPRARTEPGSFLLDARDLLVDEIEILPDGQISPRTGSVDESSITALQIDTALRQLLETYARMAREAEEGRRRMEEDLAADAARRQNEDYQWWTKLGTPKATEYRYTIERGSGLGGPRPIRPW